MEEFKEQSPDVRKISQKMQKYRYDEYEKFRKDTINLVKEEREKIIEEQSQSKNKTKDDTFNSSGGDMNVTSGHVKKWIN